MRKIASHFALLPSGLCPRPILSLNEQGQITEISTWERLDSLPGVEFYAGVLLPGMVNAHCHLELSAMAGAIPAGGHGFAAFGRAMSSIKRDVSSRRGAIAAQDAAMWSEGVAAVGDVCNGDSSFETKSRSRIEYFNFLELFGLNTPSAEPLTALAAEASRLGLRYGVTPHSTYSLQTGAFASAVSVGQAPLSIHFMESEDECELYNGRGQMQQWYDERGFPAIDFASFGSPAGRILAQVPADRDLLLIHNTCVTEQEVDALQDRFGDRLTWVVCPRSNIYITGALPPIDMLRRKGVRIAVGTDSLASNSSLSIIEDLKLFPSVPLTELLQWATVNGARALGMGDRLGSLEVGKSPGVVLLSGIDMKNLSFTASCVARRLV